MITASAPGSLMLMGEHAVLEGYKALVSAIDKRISVTLKPRQDDVITIHSSLGKMRTRLSTIVVEKPFDFVLTALLMYREQITVGLDITITASFSAEVGFGSSAAVTVATIAAMQAFTGQSTADGDVFDQAMEVLRAVQGCGSGADLAASTYGGMLAYTMGAYPERIDADMPLTLLYCGYKTPTVEVINFVRRQWADNPQALTPLYKEMGTASEKAHHALLSQDMELLQSALKTQRHLMSVLGVEDETLGTLIHLLDQHPNILAAKITGSGLGDCVLGFGRADIELPGSLEDAKVLNAAITQHGVTVEKMINEN